MIVLTKLDGKEIGINDELILFIEATPDTVLTMTTGAKLMVKEPLHVVVERVAEFRRRASPGPEVREDREAGGDPREQRGEG